MGVVGFGVLLDKVGKWKQKCACVSDLVEISFGDNGNNCR